MKKIENMIFLFLILPTYLGRRGGRHGSQANGTTHATSQPKIVNQSYEVNQRMVRREKYQVPRTQQAQPGYRTQLSTNSMI